MKTGTIEGFNGTYGSGIASLVIRPGVKGRGRCKTLYCENAPTVRALASMFPDVIGEGHTVNVGALKGKVVRYETDGMGMLSALMNEEDIDA